jgi:serine protease Do
MTRQKIFLPLAGAALVGFLAGACARRLPGPDTNKDGLEPPVQAQSRDLARNIDDLHKLSSAFAAVAQQVTPSVVNINSQQIIPGRVVRDPLGDLFGDFGFGGGMFRTPERRVQSLGSGVIVDGRGLIVTNSHVIRNATSITVTLNDRRRFPAKLLGTDPDTDVAVLKIEASDLPVLQWADSDKLQVGDIVLAVGSPFNLASTVTQGIISAKGRRDLGISAYEDFLQTDAAINPGNSGGALVDVDGNLVGINTAILSESGGNQGIGLAIPAKVARQISTQLAGTGRVTRGWLGVVVEPVTEDIATRLGLPQAQGVVVTGIYTRGPAAAQPWSPNGGDVILKANDTIIDSPGQLRNLVADLNPGAKLSLRVWQGGKTRDFSITLAPRPARAHGV